MLTVSNLSSHYGNIRAVRHLSLRVDDRGFVALIGANGSGKSTTMKTIAGQRRAATGSVVFDNTNVTNWPTHRLVHAGMTFVPERPASILLPLTVEENLRLSTFSKRGNYRELRERALELFPRLAERRSQIAGSLSGGEQQMLSLARGLMNDPKLLMIDSPVIGLAPAIVDRLYESIITIHQQGVAILLIEQNAAMALVLADYAYLLHRGEVAIEGEASELRRSEAVVDAYLG